MADPTPPTSRRFSEKEVAHIIKRASELQQEEAPAESTNGMSLAELEQVAREAGLDPALVRRAATDLDTRITDRKPSAFIGAPTMLNLERTIEGELPADEFEPMVHEIHRALGLIGTATTLGRSLQWTASGADRRRESTRSVLVTVTPRNGRTTISIEEPLGGLAAGLFGGLMGPLGIALGAPAVGIGIGAFHSGSVVVALLASVVSGSYLLARTIYGRIARGRGEALQELMSRLVEHVSATAVVAPAFDRPADRGLLEGGG
ncbi:MAG: hypothetical protein ABI601_15470 [bacterium]